MCDAEDGRLTLIYKVVGKGTDALSRMNAGEKLDVLTGLGNGYDLTRAGDRPLLLGGGAGVPPLYWLARVLREQGKRVTAVLGFNSAEDVFAEEDFRKLGCETTVTTADGSHGVRGFVTDAMPEEYSYFYACGPEPARRNTATSASAGRARCCGGGRSCGRNERESRGPAAGRPVRD